MKNVSKLSFVAALFLPFVLASCGGSGGGAPEDDSPEAQAVHFRQSIMTALAYQVGHIRGMASGDMPMDEAAFKKATHDVVALSGMIVEGFIPNSTMKGSAALPDIWMNFDDFKQKDADLMMAAQALADAADQSGVDAAKGLIQPVGQACGGCHRPYRRREED